MRRKSVLNVTVVAVALFGSLVSVALAIEGKASSKATAIEPKTSGCSCPFARNHVAGRTCCSKQKVALASIISAH